MTGGVGWFDLAQDGEDKPSSSIKYREFLHCLRNC
jgi:hypothetical protein